MVKADIDRFVKGAEQSDADPDTTQSIENREIGGMGILIVKKAWMPWIINIRTARIFLLSRKTLVQNHVTDFLEYSFILTRSV